MRVVQGSTPASWKGPKHQKKRELWYSLTCARAHTHTLLQPLDSKPASLPRRTLKSRPLQNTGPNPDPHLHRPLPPPPTPPRARRHRGCPCSGEVMVFAAVPQVPRRKKAPALGHRPKPPSSSDPGQISPSLRQLSSPSAPSEQVAETAGTGSARRLLRCACSCLHDPPLGPGTGGFLQAWAPEER